MNKGIAHILMSKLAGISFIDLYAGIVSVQEKEDTLFDNASGTGRQVTQKFPVSCDIIDFGACPEPPGRLVPLIPDSKRKGILYFEDLGTSSRGRSGVYQQYSSSLRIVVWLNTKHIDMGSCHELTMPVMTFIINKLTGNPFNQNNYNRILTTVNKIPKTGKELFSQYTYDEARTQYLLPPFEHFAIDLNVEYSINPSCIDEIQTIDPSC